MNLALLQELGLMVAPFLALLALLGLGSVWVWSLLPGTLEGIGKNSKAIEHLILALLLMFGLALLTGVLCKNLFPRLPESVQEAANATLVGASISVSSVASSAGVSTSLAFILGAVFALVCFLGFSRLRDTGAYLGKRKIGEAGELADLVWHEKSKRLEPFRLSDDGEIVAVDGPVLQTREYREEGQDNQDCS